mmetsp:Transcript_31389/g.79993  ORF Transcript_31389/g.79993 Transcript_31389/m.79993 type:complete len:780 (+) Transcript_31389:83-2422(+)
MGAGASEISKDGKAEHSDEVLTDFRGGVHSFPARTWSRTVVSQDAVENFVGPISPPSPVDLLRHRSTGVRGNVDGQRQVGGLRSGGRALRHSVASFGSFGSLQQIQVKGNMRRSRSVHGMVHVIEPATPMRRGSTDDLVRLANGPRFVSGGYGFDFEELDAAVDAVEECDHQESDEEHHSPPNPTAVVSPAPPTDVTGKLADIAEGKANSAQLGGDLMFDYDDLGDEVQEEADPRVQKEADPRPKEASPRCVDPMFDFDGLDDCPTPKASDAKESRARRPEAISSLISFDTEDGSPRRRRSGTLSTANASQHGRCRSASAPPTHRQGLRVAIIVNGSRGDIQPMVALALRLQKCDHTIRILTTADMVGLCTSHGLDAVAVFASCQEIIEKIGGMVGTGIKYTGNSCLNRARREGEKWLRDNPGACVSADDTLDDFGPDALVCGTQANGPGLRYEMSAGVPVMYAFLSRELFEFNISFVSMEPARPSFLAFSSILDKVDSEEFAEQLVQTGDWVLEEQVNAADLAADGRLFKLHKFLTSGSKPVVLGWGSMIADGLLPLDMLMLALRALSCARRRGVIIGGGARLHELGQQLLDGKFDKQRSDALELKDFAATDVCFVADAPHAWLFPQCSCVVHHGGAGTMHAALRIGIPAVITPIFGDQWANSQALKRLGAGFGFQKGLPQVTAEELGEAIPIAEAAAPGASAIAHELAHENGVQNAADVVDAFLRSVVRTGKWAEQVKKARGTPRNVKISQGARTSDSGRHGLARDRTPPRKLLRHG